MKLEISRRDGCLGKHLLGLQALSPGLPSALALVPFILCPVSNTVLIIVGRHSGKPYDVCILTNLSFNLVFMGGGKEKYHLSFRSQNRNKNNRSSLKTLTKPKQGYPKHCPRPHTSLALAHSASLLNGCTELHRMSVISKCPLLSWTVHEASSVYLPS